MNKWVSIKDKLPEEHDPVLITNFGYKDPKNERFYVVAVRRGEQYFDQDLDEDSEDNYYEPDFWMPLPTPPEGSLMQTVITCKQVGGE